MCCTTLFIWNVVEVQIFEMLSILKSFVYAALYVGTLCVVGPALFMQNLSFAFVVLFPRVVSDLLIAPTPHHPRQCPTCKQN